tara:strand:- start:1085 stop:1312 length:228 start_codon:yes stop_codon:yes gene_type:complete
MAPTRQEGLIVDHVIFQRLTAHDRAHFELYFMDGTSKSYELPVDSLSSQVKRMDVEKLDKELSEYYRPEEGPYDL